MTDRIDEAPAAARATWRFKAAMTLALTLVFCIPYFTLQRFVLFPVRTFPLTSLDRAIVFQPAWVWAYQSVYVLLVVFPWMATSRAELLRYAKGFVVVSCIGFVFFLVVPVQGPRPAVAGQNLMFRMLESYDRPLNCFPSLHVGLAVYTVLSAGGILDGRLSAGIRRTILSLAWLWTGLIAYAALATKQHYAVDLPAGALLAYICHAHAWHHTQRSTAHAEPPIVHADLSRDSLGALVRRPDSHLGPDASAVGRQ